MRRPIKKRPVVSPDIMFGSVDVERLINYVMLRGQKETARKIVYGAFAEIKERKDGGDPQEVFNTAVRNAGPLMEVRSRRVGGANYQVPREVRPERRLALALRWIITGARNQKGVLRGIASQAGEKGSIFGGRASVGGLQNKCRCGKGRREESRRGLAHRLLTCCWSGMRLVTVELKVRS